MICRPGDVVIVPFPFTDIGHAKPRPALVLSSEAANDATASTILAMITTAANSRWATDVPLKGLEKAGLKSACLVRVKLFTLDNRLISRRVGALTGQDRTAVRTAILGLITL
jgi:mRNA interferase MazF